MSKRDLLNFADWSRDELESILRLARDLKQKQKQGVMHHLLEGKGLGMLFEKPSLRTRVTFEAGMVQLGGHAVFLSPTEVQMGVRETPEDCARSLSRWVDMIVVRTFAQATLEEMARAASVPVINALTDLYHPCQVLADCLTLLEHKGKLKGLKVAFVGDGNNMVHSWMEAAEKIPFSFALACPKGYEPDTRYRGSGKKKRRARDRNPFDQRRFERSRCDLHRCLDQHGAGVGRRHSSQSFPRISGEPSSPGHGQKRCCGDALLTGPPGPGNHRRGLGEPAVHCLRPG